MKSVRENLLKNIHTGTERKDIELQVILVETLEVTDQIKAPYSPKERLEQMRTSNPAVTELIRKLGLRFEF